MAESSEVIGTPEGDNEFDPSEPLKPLPDGAIQIPDGNAPDVYRQPESDRTHG